MNYTNKLYFFVLKICINAKNVVSLQREKKSTGVLKWSGSYSKEGQKWYLRYNMVPLSIHSAYIEHTLSIH